MGTFYLWKFHQRYLARNNMVWHTIAGSILSQWWVWIDQANIEAVCYRRSSLAQEDVHAVSGVDFQSTFELIEPEMGLLLQSPVDLGTSLN